MDKWHVFLLMGVARVQIIPRYNFHGHGMARGSRSTAIVSQAVKKSSHHYPRMAAKNLYRSMPGTPCDTDYAIGMAFLRGDAGIPPVLQDF